MNSPSTAPPRRRRGTLGATAVLIFILQLALIFWLSDRTSARVRTPPPAPTVHLRTARPEELLALEDPTLFVLPHERGFSGEAWMNTGDQQFESSDWADTNRWLVLSEEELGTEFGPFVRTNALTPAPAALLFEAGLTVPTLTSTFHTPTSPDLHVEGDLARRRPLSNPRLSPRPGLLTNTIVQLLVDEQGHTFSAILVPPGSGSKEADGYALSIAKAMRFESMEATGPDRAAKASGRLTWGTMIFEWPMLPGTNGIPLPLLEQ